MEQPAEKQETAPLNVQHYSGHANYNFNNRQYVEVTTTLSGEASRGTTTTTSWKQQLAALSNDFVERKEYGDLISCLCPRPQDNCASSPGSCIAQTRIFFLHGLPGIGKTQLSLKFVKDYQDR